MTNTANRRISTRRLVATASAGALALVLAACGSDEPDDTVSGPDPVEVQPDDTGSDTPPSSAQGTGDLTALLTLVVTAGRTAEAAVPGSRVIHMDLEDRGDWEVDVVTDDGTEHEVRVSSDGTNVLDGPRRDSTDADDRRENSTALDRAELDFERALSALVTQVPDAEVDELSLDVEDNSVRWEIELTNGDEYDVDAVTGAIARR